MGDAVGSREKMSQSSFDVVARIIVLTKSNKLKWARYKYGMAVSTVYNWIFCFAVGGFKFGRGTPLFVVGLFDIHDCLGNVVGRMGKTERLEVRLEPALDQELLIAIRDQFRRRGQEGILAVMENDCEMLMKSLAKEDEEAGQVERARADSYLGFCKKALDKT